MLLLLCFACAARHSPAPAPAEPPAPAEAETPPDLPRTAVSPDGWAMLGTKAGETVLVAGATPIGEGPVIIPLGVATGEEVGEEEFPCTGNVRLAPEWTGEEVVGRSVTALPTDNAKYRSLISEALGREEPGIVGLWKLDLEGDGTDEVLFAVREEEERARYNAVGLRRVGAGGAVDTIMFHEGSWEAYEDDPDAQRGLDGYVSAELWGLTDAEGDGELEIVLAMSAWESYGHQVLDASGTALGGSGCGV